MHRKNYKEIAAVLAGEFACSNEIGKLAIWRVALSLADVFKQGNIRFDRSRFYEAVFGDSDHFAVRDRLTNTGKPSWMEHNERVRSPHTCYPEGGNNG